MHIYRLNQPIFDFSPEHPARRFLEAFIACRQNCVGKELEGTDQQWFSKTENRLRTFSSFVYEWLSFDIELDGWLRRGEGLTASEQQSLEAMPYIETLTRECREAAVAEGHITVTDMCDQLLDMLQLWKACIAFRLEQALES